MKRIHFPNMFFSMMFAIFLLQTSCTTEDILPTIELSTDKDNLSEANGTLILTATINTVASENVSIPILTSGTATLSSDYSLSASEIVINSGQSSGSITVTGLQDQQIEGVETLVLDFGQTSSFLNLGNSTLQISVLDDDADSDNDGVLDSNDDCPNLAGDPSNNGCPFLGFLINEVLYDPASGADGDANGDGTRNANEDEFIEFFNSGPQIDISGYTVSDESSFRHTFPTGTVLGVNKVLVLFGGGTPTGNFGGALVQTASEGLLNITNSGDIMTMRDTNGNVVVVFDTYPLSGNPDEAYTRSPDLTGDFAQHAGIPEANGKLFSPGTKLDGSLF
ncbi:MAG: lamin tail domain-containing protein [Polaribacter sp.]|uniref:lamin tail domain-containing protein n=1 Tax=Polaribacter sp. TaxID=1920175 RepID=UPI003BB02976